MLLLLIVFGIIVYFVARGYQNKSSKTVNHVLEIQIGDGDGDDDFTPYWRMNNYNQEYVIKKMQDVSSAGAVSNNLPIPSVFANTDEWYIKLVLAESRSVSFQDCLAIIKDIPTYKEYMENETQRYEVSFPREELAKFKTVYDMVKTLKGTRVYIYNELIDKQNLARLLRCSVDKAKSSSPTFCYGVSPFTANSFGCHRIMVRMYGDGAWYKYASWQNGRVVIDKQKILNKMTENLKEYRFCPFLNLKEVWNNFLALPDHIDLDNENFAIIRTHNGQVQVESRWETWGHYKSYQECKRDYGDSLLSTR